MKCKSFAFIIILISAMFEFKNCDCLSLNRTTAKNELVKINGTCEPNCDVNSTSAETNKTNTTNLTRLQIDTIALNEVNSESLNVSMIVSNTSDTNESKPKSNTYVLRPPKKELPIAIIIAGPTAAFSIAVFLCILYYWHTVQLNQQAKRLSMTIYITPDQSSENSRNTMRPQKLVPAPFNSRHSSRDGDLYSQRRKSTLTLPSLGGPGPMGKRGSSWSALADQEILNIAAPRRHSTFIL